MSSILPSSLKPGLLAFVLLAASLLLNSLPAQDAAPAAATPAPAAAAPAADAPTATAKPTTLGDMLSQGGPVMWILGAASVCLVWFTAEGLFTLRVGKLAPNALVARLREAISSGNFQEAWNICRANRCFLSAVVAAGLERIGRSKEAVEFAVEETALRESTLLKTNITYLSVIGVVAPMVGLTGTVWGMIHAFHTLGENGISNPAELAKNIGEVLVATVSGLILAIPAFVAFYILRARSQGAILHAESQVYRLLDDIPYEQVTGVRIGENFSADQGGKSRTGRSGATQTVSRNVTTNCPACNAPIKVGTSPCPNCGTVLDWGS
jgi:biopolymer transport protein ExbB